MKIKKIHIITILICIIIISSIIFSGCVQKRDSLLVNNIERTYIIHVPSSYHENEPVPLVIVLHGGGGNAKNIEEVTGFSDKADQKGFIVVYPDGTGKLRYRLLTWNGGFCCGYALQNNVDDVYFIKTLISHIQSIYSVNESRIYVTGISNGGVMTYRIASELSDIIAAAAPVAGSIGGQATEQEKIWRISEPKYPVSIITFHGMNDTRVPYDGGHSIENDTYVYYWMSVNESISFWTYHNHCYKTPVTNISDSGNIIIDTYKGGKNNTEVVLYTIVNGTHSWPGGKKGWKNGDNPTLEISATDIIWDFFESHPKESNQ
jgi:polyhydroxybutyrate depolymerase